VLIIIVVWATIVWLLVTLFTRPTREQTLLDFYRRVHPGGAGWRRISKQLPEVKGDTGYGYLFLNWIAGSVMVLFILFAIGKFIFAEYTSALIYLSISIIAAIFIYYSMKRIGWSKVVE